MYKSQINVIYTLFNITFCNNCVLILQYGFSHPICLPPMLLKTCTCKYRERKLIWCTMCFPFISTAKPHKTKELFAPIMPHIFKIMCVRCRKDHHTHPHPHTQSTSLHRHYAKTLSVKCWSNPRLEECKFSLKKKRGRSRTEGIPV